MKFKFIYTIFSLTFLAIVFSSSSGGRASSANSGNTGAPGDSAPTCVTCHGNNAAIQVTLSIDILDDTGNSIATEGYTPETTYEVMVTINVDEGTPSAFGFQVLGLNASLGESGPQATNWSDPADNVQIATVSTSGRVYAEHKGPSTTNEFRVKWTAPAEGSGAVSFYSCGNGVNMNGETSGDNAACNNIELAEKTNVSTSQPIEELELAIAPNPASDWLNLLLYSPNSGDYDLSITDLMGREVFTENISIQQGKTTAPVSVSQLNAGIYFLHLKGNGKIVSQQIIKR